MMDQRGDFFVHGEPYYKYYLNDTNSKYIADTDFSCVTELLVHQSTIRQVFIKEMAHHVVGYVGDEIFERGENTFLIRDPRLSIPSLYTMLNDYTEKDAGFDSQLELFEKVRTRTGRLPVVIDGETLRQDPARVVTAYFGALGLDPMLHALNWQKGGRSDWIGREDWHRAASSSTSFEPNAGRIDLDRYPLRVRQTIERCLPIYKYLRDFAVGRR
ncbi:hypothetical protein J2X72_002510 [Phyllobacterium sp. 1468]|nr:hypothetical protein [Phyllobacterium sp. 1468]